MARRIVLTTARIIPGILTLKVTYNKFQFYTYRSTRTYYILKTGIITNKIYIKRLSTATGMYSSNWCDIEKNRLIFKP